MAEDDWPYNGEWPVDWVTRHTSDPNLWLRASAHISGYVADAGGPLRCLPRLTPGWRVVLVVTRLSGQVNNGGFQSLWYYDPWTVPPSAEAFRLIGAEKLALLLETVANAADWSGEDNRGKDACDLNDAEAALFDERYFALDNGMAPGGYELGEMVNAYMRTHPRQFAPLF